MCLSPIKAHAEIHISWKCDGEESKPICASKGGMEYIYIYGHIDEGVARVMATIDGFLPLNAKLPKIYLNSTGGQIVSARHVGRILRRRAAEVTTYDPFNPQYAAECYSACATIAAGAVIRNLNHVGLHSGYITKRENGKESRHPLAEGSVKLHEDYYVEMEMSQRVIQIQHETPPEKIADYYYDPDKPLEEQEIFKIGFRMQPANSDETIKIKNARSTPIATQWLDRANAGDASAAFKLAQWYFEGRDVIQNNELGRSFYEKASALGNNAATHNLAVAYSDGRHGLKVDKKKAVSLYLIAAKAGFAPSQNNLGWMYYKGEGTVKNLPEAIYWVTRAAEQGEPFAYGSLGSIRADGNGFKRDYIEAYKWLSLAVQHMPEGKARDSDEAKLKDLMKLMSDKLILEGEAAAEYWNKKRETIQGMKDKDAG
jgi:TPR repeat protein